GLRRKSRIGTLQVLPERPQPNLALTRTTREQLHRIHNEPRPTLDQPFWRFLFDRIANDIQPYLSPLRLNRLDCGNRLWQRTRPLEELVAGVAQCVGGLGFANDADRRATFT